MRQRRCRGLLYERRQRQTMMHKWYTFIGNKPRRNNVWTADSGRVHLHGVCGSIERNRVTMLFPLLAYNHMHFSNWIIIYHYYTLPSYLPSANTLLWLPANTEHIVSEATCTRCGYLWISCSVSLQLCICLRTFHDDHDESETEKHETANRTLHISICAFRLSPLLRVKREMPKIHGCLRLIFVFSLLSWYPVYGSPSPSALYSIQLFSFENRASEPKFWTRAFPLIGLEMQKFQIRFPFASLRWKYIVIRTHGAWCWLPIHCRFSISPRICVWTCCFGSCIFHLWRDLILVHT